MSLSCLSATNSLTPTRDHSQVGNIPVSRPHAGESEPVAVYSSIAFAPIRHRGHSHCVRCVRIVRDATCCVACLIAIVGCDSAMVGTSQPRPTASTTVSSTDATAVSVPESSETTVAATLLPPFPDLPLGRVGCTPASPVDAGGGLPEIRGTIVSGSPFGLVFADSAVFRVGEDVKIVWRMTGVGDLQTTLESPTGALTPLLEGPTPHGGSSYHPPGDEWGTFLRFPESGCWHMTFHRSTLTGDVWVQVAPAGTVSSSPSNSEAKAGTLTGSFTSSH